MLRNSRRQFLGSLLGAVFAKNFFARLKEEPLQMPQKFGYKMLFRDSLSGFSVQAPAIEEIIRVSADRVRFVCAPLAVMQTMKVDGALLYDDQSEIGDSLFSCPVCAVNGDTLKVTYDLVTDIPTRFSIEDIIKMKREKYLAQTSRK